MQRSPFRRLLFKGCPAAQAIAEKRGKLTLPAFLQKRKGKTVAGALSSAMLPAMKPIPKSRGRERIAEAKKDLASEASAGHAGEAAYGV